MEQFLVAGSGKRRGDFRTAAALALFFVLLSAAGTYLIVTRKWWFPDSISSIAPLIDRQFNVTMVYIGAIFVMAQVFLGLLVFAYRDRGGSASYIRGNLRLEILWTAAAAVLFMALALSSRSAWSKLDYLGSSPEALQIEVTAAQFEWQFRYPGPDGKFGLIDPGRIDEAAGNPLGLDYSEPEAKDDLVMPVMAIPVNREVELILRSKDVIHDFYCPALRIKQDAVPGMSIRIHFTADRIGQYEVACAELCGLGHYRMRTTMTVMSERDYERWLHENAPR